MPRFADEIITSRKNPLITRMAKLSDKKFRDAEGLFRIDGVKLFLEAAKSGASFAYIFLAQSKKERLEAELGDALASADGTGVYVSDEVLEKLTDEAAPQGIVAAVHRLDTMPAEIPAEGGFRALWLSSIRDPGNLGTMIRTAYAFGVDRVFVSRDCADLWSPKTLRASMGTMFRQPISVIDDEPSFAGRLRAAGCEVYAAALRRDAMKLGGFRMPERVCFAVGNEGHGLSDELIDACVNTVFIPMNPGCESLNAASAATTLIWEMCRDRLTD